MPRIRLGVQTSYSCIIETKSQSFMLAGCNKLLYGTCIEIIFVKYYITNLYIQICSPNSVLLVHAFVFLTYPKSCGIYYWVLKTKVSRNKGALHCTAQVIYIYIYVAAGREPKVIMSEKATKQHLSLSIEFSCRCLSF